MSFRSEVKLLEREIYSLVLSALTKIEQQEGLEFVQREDFADHLVRITTNTVQDAQQYFLLLKHLGENTNREDTNSSPER